MIHYFLKNPNCAQVALCLVTYLKRPCPIYEIFVQFAKWR